MSDGLNIASQAIAFGSGIAGVMAVVVDIASHRDKPFYFRRITGWATAFLGLLAGVGVTLAFSSRDIAVRTPVGVLLVISAVAGAVLAAYGVWRALTVQVDPAIKRLQEISRAMVRHVEDLQRADGNSTADHVPFAVHASHSRRWSRSRLLPEWALQSKKKIVLVAASPGAGKSMALREATRTIAIAATRSRRKHPKAAYIDLRAVAEASGAVTAHTIREHLRDVVRRWDPELVEELNEQLRGEHDMGSWVFFFDSLDTAVALGRTPGGPVSAGDNWAEIERFVNLSGFSAIVASRTRPAQVRPTASLVLNATESRWIRAFVTGRNLPVMTATQLLAWIERRALPAAPLLLDLLVEHAKCEGAPQVGQDPFDVLDVALRTRINACLIPGSDVGDVLATAERLAFRRAGCAAIEQAGDGAALEVLKEARIVRRAVGDAWEFKSHFLLTHFAIRSLLHGHVPTNTRDLLVLPLWRVPVVAVLRRGSERLVGDLFATAGQLVGEEVDRTAAVVPDVAPYLVTQSRGRLEPVSSTFRWPKTALTALRTLSEAVGDGPRTVPDSVFVPTARMVVSAFVPHSTLTDRKNALTVLPAASPEVSAWAVERAVTSRSFYLGQAAAEQVAGLSGLYGKLAIWPRFLLAGFAFTRPALIADILSGRRGTPVGKRSLGAVVLDLIRVLQIVAFVVALRSAVHILIELSDRQRPDEIGEWLFWSFVGFGFLASTRAPLRREARVVGALTGVLVAMVIGLATVSGVLLVLPGAVDMLTGNWSTRTERLVTACLQTQAFLVACHVVTTRKPMDLRGWLLPHLPLISLGIDPLRRLNYADELRKLGRSALTFAALGAGLWALAAANLPGVEGDAEAQARGGIFISVVIVARVSQLARDYWRLYRDRRDLRKEDARQVESGELLRRFLNARTQQGTQRLLKVLEDAPGRMLVQAEDALSDLALALDHVGRFVQPDSKKPFREAVWRDGIGPDFAHVGFHTWILEYDRKHPGRLFWMSKKAQDSIARSRESIERAKDKASTDLLV